jgi:hypothetical protein
MRDMSGVLRLRIKGMDLSPHMHNLTFYHYTLLQPYIPVFTMMSATR